MVHIFQDGRCRYKCAFESQEWIHGTLQRVIAGCYLTFGKVPVLSLTITWMPILDAHPCCMVISSSIVNTENKDAKK